MSLSKWPFLLLLPLLATFNNFNILPRGSFRARKRERKKDREKEKERERESGEREGERERKGDIICSGVRIREGDEG